MTILQKGGRMDNLFLIMGWPGPVGVGIFLLCLGGFIAIRTISPFFVLCHGTTAPFVFHNPPGFLFYDLRALRSLSTLTRKPMVPQKATSSRSTRQNLSSPPSLPLRQMPSSSNDPGSKTSSTTWALITIIRPARKIASLFWLSPNCDQFTSYPFHAGICLVAFVQAVGIAAPPSSFL